jgi:hypothetical protein
MTYKRARIIVEDVIIKEINDLIINEQPKWKQIDEAWTEVKKYLAEPKD